MTGEEHLFQFLQVFLVLHHHVIEYSDLVGIIFPRLLRGGAQNKSLLVLLCGQVPAERLCIDLMVHFYNGYLLRKVFELPDVSSPISILEQRRSLFVEGEGRHLVAVAEIHGEFSEQQWDIFLALSESGDTYLHGVETVIQVLAEPSVVNSLPHIQVRSRYYAYVGFTHLAGAHAQVFARLQYAQQTNLRLKGQFSYFVQKQRTAVGNLEISLVLVLGIGKSAFLVTEKLTVYRALRDGTAVHREIGPVFAGGIGVDNLREMLFTNTGFPGDEHAQIGARYLNGNLNVSIEQRTLADYTEPLFDG